MDDKQRDTLKKIKVEIKSEVLDEDPLSDANIPQNTFEYRREESSNMDTRQPDARRPEGDSFTEEGHDKIIMNWVEIKKEVPDDDPLPDAPSSSQLPVLPHPVQELTNPDISNNQIRKPSCKKTMREAASIMDDEQTDARMPEAVFVKEEHRDSTWQEIKEESLEDDPLSDAASSSQFPTMSPLPVPELTTAEITDTQNMKRTCTVCNKKFAPSYLKSHMRTHTKEKPFSCEKCNKTFALRPTLVKHMRTHTKEKPYKCDICGKAFSHSGNLKGHKRIHTNEKPFHCDICNKAFSQWGNLMGHKRIHTNEKPFRCDICNKAFTQLGNLVGHKRVHTNEKPFSCDICHKTFARRLNLVEHKELHVEEKTFSCGMCQKSFALRSKLVRHMQTHAK